MTFLLLFLVSALFFINPASGGLGSNAVPYRPDLASIGLDLSNAAYCERDDIVNWSCPPCKRLQAAGIVPSSTPIVIDGVVGGFGVVKKWGTRAVIAVLPGYGISVAFRGSANITNWLEDFDFFGLVPYHDACPTCRVHEGFYQSWFSLARPVLQAVSDLHAESPKAEILVTGHSLGAAQAVLAATELYYDKGLPVTQVYTYGQPRVGNRAFRQFYNNGTSKRQYAKPGASFRVVHWRDPVPQLPFNWLGFEHTSTEVWYNEHSSNFTVCDGSGEDPKCSRSLGLDLLDASDHTSYLARPTGGASCIQQP
jgi:hypothetical protein